MTITLGVAWALFVLAPGLAVFAALYTAGGSRVIAPAPPAPNSFTALSVVIFGALVSHFAASTAFTLGDVVGARWTLFETPWNPNPYAYFLSPRSRPDPHLGLEVSLLLGSLLGTSWIAYLATRSWVASAERRTIERLRAGKGEAPATLFRFLYGSWAPTLAQLSEEAGYDKHLAAYVVTDMEADGRWIGYEGEVENLTLDTDKQIAALALRNCKAFKLSSTRTGLDHRVVARSTDIPRLLIERSQIKNIALQVVFRTGGSA